MKSKLATVTTNPRSDEWERDRLAALQRFDVLDSPREEAFDRITALIKNIFDVEIAIVSMIDGHRQWYKSVEGLTTSEAPRNETFCRLVLDDNLPLVIRDARNDPRVADNPSVVGDPHVRFYAGVPLLTAEGHAIGTVCAIDSEPREFSDRELNVLTDLSRMAMSELELRQRASTDVLTGVLSRRAFKEEATRSLALAARHDHPLSCIAIDLDRFKNVNDTFGHAAGDRVLVDAVKACVGELRQTDLMGRLGGEEFAVLLPHTEAKHAAEVAEKLRVAIERLNFTFAGRSLQVTASLGVAETAGSGDADWLLERADEALYEAKSLGRNCVRMSGQAVMELLPGRRVLKAAQLVFNGRSSVVDCTVRMLAQNGARLGVSTTMGLPKEFLLRIPSDRFESRCRVVATKTDQVDALFA